MNLKVVHYAHFWGCSDQASRDYQEENCTGEEKKKAYLALCLQRLAKTTKHFFNFLLTDVLLELLYVCHSGRGSASLEQVLSTLCDITESRDVTQM